MANEARLNLVISARDEAKAVIESFANSIKDTFSGLQQEIANSFNMSSVEQSFRMISDVAMLTRTSVEESLNGMRMSSEGLSSSINQAADSTVQGFRNMAEGINGARSQIQQDMDQIAQSTQHMSESLDFMNLQMAGQMIEEVGQKITEFFGDAVSSAADFDQNIVNTTASLNANLGTMKLSTDQINAMQAAAIRMGESGFYSANQVAEAMNTMSRNGLTYQQIMSGGIDTVYKVAAANQSDIEQTANVVSDIYNEMGDTFKLAGMNATQAAQQIGNSMTVAMHHARISMDDFMNTMKYVGPQASAMGVGIKDVSSLISLLGQHAIRGTQAGTTLRTMMTNLTPVSKAAAEQMKSLGMITKDGSNIFFDASGKMKPMAEVQQLLHDKLGALNPQMQELAIKTIFGRYALSGMTAIVDTAPSKFQSLTAAMNNNNTMTDIMKEKSQGLGMQLQKLDSHWITIKKTIGEALKPIVESLIGILNGLMKMWEGLNPVIQNGIIIIAAVTGVVLLVGGAILALVGTMGMFYTAWESGVEVLGVMASAAPEVIIPILAIGAAIAGLAYVWNNDFGGIQTKTKEVFGYISQAFNGLKNLWSGNGGKGASILNNLGFSPNAVLAIENIFARIKEGINGVKTAFNNVKSFVQGFFMILTGTGGGKGIDILQKLGFSKNTISELMKIGGQIKSTFDGIKSTVTTVITNINNVVRPIITSLLNFWNTHQYQFRQTVQTVWNAIGSFLRTAVSAIVNTIGPAITTIYNWWKQYWPEIQQVFVEVWNVMKVILAPIIAVITAVIIAGIGFIKGAWQNGWNAIKDVLKAVWDLISGVIKTAWDLISGIISIGLDLLTGHWGKAWDDIKSTFSNVWNDITGTFSHLLDDAINFGSNFVQMIANGITGAVGAVTSAVSGVADKIKGFLGFHSPTREGPASESDVWAPNFVNMMADGIKKHTPQIQAAVNGIALSMKTGVTSVSHNVSQNQISIPSTRANQAQTVINIQIDGRSTKTDNDLAEIIAHKLYRQMPVVS